MADDGTVRVYHDAMLSPRVPLTGVAAAFAFALAATAQAEPKSLSDDSPSFYLYGSPALFAVPLGDDSTTDVIDVSYQWGLGLGGVFAVGDRKNVGIGIGFGFEHNPATIDSDYCVLSDCAIHAFRLLPELRIGGIVDQLYAYGVVAPGLGIVHVVNDVPFFPTYEDTDYGFNFGFGGGVQYIVWEGLFVGGELGFDVGIYIDDERPIDDDYGVYLMDLKALVGYNF